MIIIVLSLLILALLGLIFGVLLSLLEKKWRVKEDNRIVEATKLLPNYNCGSCGYAGCKALIEAIIKGEENKISKCKPGKKENFEQIVLYFKNHKNPDGSEVDIKL